MKDGFRTHAKSYVLGNTEDKNFPSTLQQESTITHYIMFVATSSKTILQSRKPFNSERSLLNLVH